MLEDVKSKITQPINAAAKTAIEPIVEPITSMIMDFTNAAKKAGNMALAQVSSAKTNLAYQRGIWDCKRNICNPPSTSDEENESYLRGYNEEYSKKENKGIVKNGFIWAGAGAIGGIFIGKWLFGAKK